MEFVRYKDFGAKGDGVTNDFFAIKAAHEYANKQGLPVVAEAGRNYLISNTETDGVASTIPIRTDTNWCGCNIIFDDREIGFVEGKNKNHNSYVFTVENDYPSVKLSDDIIKKINDAGGIDPKTVKKIDTGLGYPALLLLFNEGTQKFIRYGNFNGKGAVQKEIIMVDAEGNILPETPFMFPFERVTSITAFRTDTRPITLKNAIMTTLSSRVNLEGRDRSMNRGFRVLRPNTTLLHIDHFVTGQYEKDEIVDGKPFTGHTYNSFLAVQYCSNVLVDDFSFMSRIHYIQGTYDIDVTYANAVVFKNCHQKDFFTDEFPEHYNYPNIYKCWGVMGSSYCKNIDYINCSLTRFDAHAGIYNGRIINSEIASIRLTGGGDFYIENTKIYSRNFVTPLQLREDYGATWDGTITLKDCTFVDVCRDRSLQSFIFVRSPNWYFGYETHFPNILIDNLKFEGAKEELSLIQPYQNNPNSPYFYRTVEDENIGVAGAVCQDGKENLNPYIAPEFIKVINNEENGYKFTLPRLKFFENTKIEGVEIK